jgi:xylulokinase
MLDHVIGVDIGTQSTKALLTNATGHIVARHSQSYHPDTPRPLWAEQWPDVWLGAVVACVAACVAQAPGARIATLCVSSLYGGSGIPVDAGLRPQHPCPIWMDRRATAEVDWVRATVDPDRLGNITHNGIDSYILRLHQDALAAAQSAGRVEAHALAAAAECLCHRGPDR